MAVVSYTVPNLALTPSNAYIVPAALEYVFTEGDLSQLGEDRTTLDPALQIPAVTNASITFPRSALHPFWANNLRVPDNAGLTEAINVEMKITTRDLLNTRIGTTQEAHNAAIKGLQGALDPIRPVDVESIVNDPRMAEHLTSLAKKSESASAICATGFTELVSNNDRFYKWAREALGLPEATIRDDIIFTANMVKDMSYANWITAISMWRDRSDQQATAVKVMDALKMIDSAPGDESTYQHELINDVYIVVRAELTLSAFVPPESILALFSGNETMDKIRVSMHYASDDGTVSGAYEIPPSKLRMIKELGVYCLALKQLGGAALERCREFAFTRMLLHRHGLIADSKEIKEMSVVGTLIVEMSEVSTWLGYCRGPEMFYMCMMTAVISFLKSGHHASAANLDNTLEKMLGAISVPVTRELARSLLATSVYNGTHPASMRLMAAYSMHRAQSKKMSGAITYRLATVPPLAMGYTNLEIFMDALNAAEFFQNMNRTAEYATFKAHMKTIRMHMWYVAPYSLYMYGKSVGDPIVAKAEAARYAAYAHALAAALPNSTLIYSPALRKMATQAAVNSVAATLMIEGYVDAFRRFFKQAVSRTLTEKKGIRRVELID